MRFLWRLLPEVCGIIWIQDIVEIVIISMIIRRFLRWLTHESMHHAAPMVYAAVLILMVACIAHLSTIQLLFMWYGPALLMLLMFSHQESVQRSLSLQKINPHYADALWIDSFIRVCLLMQAKQKSLHIIIERRISVGSFIASAYPVQAPLLTNTLLLLIESAHYHEHDFIIIDGRGYIQSCNAHFLRNQSTEALNHHNTLRDMALLTKKTDALIVLSNGINKDFTVIAEETIVEHLNGTQTTSLLKYYLFASTTWVKRGTLYHEPIHKTNANNQCSP